MIKSARLIRKRRRSILVVGEKTSINCDWGAETVNLANNSHRSGTATHIFVAPKKGLSQCVFVGSCATLCSIRKIIPNNIRWAWVDVSSQNHTLICGQSLLWDLRHVKQNILRSWPIMPMAHSYFLQKGCFKLLKFLHYQKLGEIGWNWSLIYSALNYETT